MSLKSTLEHAQQCVVAIIINRGVAGEVVEITVERSGAASKILRRLVCNLRLGVNERRTLVAAFIGGALIGALGGLIGLGGAEFRLPLLIGCFRFGALEAVILNKAMSLFVVASALPFRAPAVPLGIVADHWTTIVNLLAGSLLGAWLGAGWATRLTSSGLYRAIALLLFVIASILLAGHDAAVTGQPLLNGTLQVVAGVVCGYVIGVVASLLGVAGGELLIPTLVLLFGADVKLAGSLSLAVSLPTMIAGFARYSRDQSFMVLGKNRVFVLVMATGSTAGSFIGGRMLGIMPSAVLLPLLAAVLLISAVRIWRHV
jgi:uncharacterized membrane protein YfcA